MHGPTRFAQPQLAEYIAEGLDGVDVRLRGREAGTHRVDRDVARTGIQPSPIRAARLSTGSAAPPNQIGMGR